MGMKSKSNHFPSGSGAGGPSKRNGNANGNNMKRSQKGRELLDKASNEKLKNHIKELYRPGAKVGDGGAADALKAENKTGQKVGGKSHATKAKERLSALKKLYNKGNLSAKDKSITKKLIDDLEDALKGWKK